MSSAYERTVAELRRTPRRWLVTGAAGFIGSNLVEKLLSIGQKVVGLDNFATGHRHNLDLVKAAVGEAQYQNFNFIEGDIVKLDNCHQACKGIEYVLHQAALGSVPRSVADPLSTNRVNVEGFLNMLLAARDAKVRRFVYASSSSVYGDSEQLPKKEGNEGTPLSPYAVSKAVNELYASVWKSTYGLPSVGLRYFNVFGPRQDPNGAYAAVVPRWVASALRNEQCVIFGDGETSRDFCHIDNVVQANILAAYGSEESANQVYNIACGDRITLNQLHDQIWNSLVELRGGTVIPRRHEPFRAGDVRHSLADIGNAERLLGYQPSETLRGGLTRLVAYMLQRQA